MELKRTNHKIIAGALLMGLAVALGAMGAHALEKILTPKNLATFKTGVHYQMLHAFGLIFLGILDKLYRDKFKIETALFTLGIILFSFNCYIYSLTNIKVFAMLIPIGGVTFIMGWLSLGLRFFKISRNYEDLSN
ncbi:putative membrane protein [Halobacteriovorax marinus SJ]|uniref:Membrane protein n=1 Tax=Halobacteriovorax marinus (strain ATCC BAA-682 / DSM 15412 / SJ) TaxID=862908 RepID=E1X3S6_HALMS|nr:DUF423 domain-containing protein [Halobacteriovorax marinus]CBW27005.1 putative membrane protein [Halobacteriovorax marinus SJ]